MGSADGGSGSPDETEEPDSKAYVENRLDAARRLEQEKDPSAAVGLIPAVDSSDNGEVATTEKDEDSESALLSVELRLRNAQVANEEQDLNLRRMVAKWSIGFVCAQLVAANLFIGWYLWFNRVNPDAKIMTVWLASSVIEVIGIVVVIATSLFPGRKKKRKRHSFGGASGR